MMSTDWNPKLFGDFIALNVVIVRSKSNESHTLIPINLGLLLASCVHEIHVDFCYNRQLVLIDFNTPPSFNCLLNHSLHQDWQRLWKIWGLEGSKAFVCVAQFAVSNLWNERQALKYEWRSRFRWNFLRSKRCAPICAHASLDFDSSSKNWNVDSLKDLTSQFYSTDPV